MNSSIARPIAEAGVVVLLPLNLAARGVGNVDEQRRAVCLEDVPSMGGSRDDDIC